ncbi:MAG: hypothetical protein U1F24_10580 [Alphaproteobacteria bacterium]
MSVGIKSLFAAALVSAGALIMSAHADSPSYQLTCTSGGTMQARLNHSTDRAGQITGSSLSIWFTPSGGAATAVQPPPGTCAWSDRMLRSGEPTQLWLTAPGAALDFNLGQNGADAVVGVGPEPYRSRLQFLARALTRPGSTFTVMARTNNGVLEITDIAP